MFAIPQVGARSQESDTVRFAVIGDYGAANSPYYREVVEMVKGWNPDFIVTVGDNNYPDGEAKTIDANVGQFFHEYIFPYQGSYGPGAETNRFFPVIGNHDRGPDGLQPYLNYFTLPNDELYYDFVQGPVHFFMLDSDSDGAAELSETSVQGQWFQAQIAAATEPWKLAVMHHPPYSSNRPKEAVRLPYKAWGASAVLTGHDHYYERLDVDGFPYFIIADGGDNLYALPLLVPEDVIAYNSSHGATLVTASPEQITFEHYLTLGKPLTWVGVLKIGEWVEVDVTPAVTGDGVYNWALITGSKSDLFFNSKENKTNQPELVVETDASTTPSRFAPSDDTYVSSADEGDNLGKKNSIRLRRSFSRELDAYFRFNVAGLNGKVQRATLRLYLASGEVNGGVALFRVADTLSDGSTPWGEHNLTYATAPVIQGPVEPIDRCVMTASGAAVEDPC